MSERPTAATDRADRMAAQIGFVVEADRLKGVLRQNLLVDGSRRENSAEHSWHVALFARVLAEYAPPGTDLDRVVAMLVVHDLVEIDAGDTDVYDTVATATQDERERAAADRLYALLPADQAEDMRALWEEFEARETREARFAKAIDRFAPIVGHWHTDGDSWRRRGVRRAQVAEKVEIIAQGSPELGAYAAELLEEADRRGYLAG